MVDAIVTLGRDDDKDGRNNHAMSDRNSIGDIDPMEAWSSARGRSVLSTGSMDSIGDMPPGSQMNQDAIVAVIMAIVAVIAKVEVNSKQRTFRASKSSPRSNHRRTK